MEIELKYKVKDKNLMQNILADEYLADIEEKDSHEEVLMKAAYFDTEDCILSKNDIAFRIRMEGSKIIASLKWNDSVSGGLYIRDEVNVPVNDMGCFLNPDPAVFRESEMGKDLLELLNGKPLYNVLEMKFLRNKRRIDTGNAICEVSMDEGDIITDFGRLQLREMEIELFSGDRSDLLKIGEKLAERYGLEAELESKYARGLKFLEQGRALGNTATV